METQEDRQAQGTSQQGTGPEQHLFGPGPLGLIPLPPPYIPLPLLCVSWLCLGQEASKDKMAWTK